METIEREDRFLLDGLPKRLDFGTLVKREHIVQFYLAPTEKKFTPRVRRKKDLDSGEVTYEYLQKGTRSVGVKVEKDQETLSRKKFFKLRRERKEIGTRHVKKVRLTFEHNGMKLEIDIFRGRNKGTIILEVEHTRVGDKATLTDLPESLRPYVVRDITGETRYTNHNLARLINPKPRPVMLRTVTAKGVIREKQRDEVPRRWQRAMAA